MFADNECHHSERRGTTVPQYINGNADPDPNPAADQETSDKWGASGDLGEVGVGRPQIGANGGDLDKNAFCAY